MIRKKQIGSKLLLLIVFLLVISTSASLALLGSGDIKFSQIGFELLETKSSGITSIYLDSNTNIKVFSGVKGNNWKSKYVYELEKGQEFLYDGKLHYIDQNGFVRIKSLVDIKQLPEADQYYQEDQSRTPQKNDVVRFVDKNCKHLRHDQLKTVKPNEQFYFQGCLYEAKVSEKSQTSLTIRNTGTVLRPPYYPHSYDDEDVDPETWRSIKLEKQEADGSRTIVELLRPIWWLDECNAKESGTLYLDLAEMGVSGDFDVKAISPCPEIKNGASGTRPVIGKFFHENSIALNMYFEGEDKPLGVTANHPIWSETHQKYMPAGEFKVGDEVQTLDGISKLLKVTQKTGRHTVYNLEVHKDHVYRVGDSAILVHNSCSAQGFSAKEQAIADYIQGFGRKVSKNSLEGVTGAGRQGDAIIDGVLHEFKSLDSGATSNTIRNVVNNSIRKGGQARNIVIDARGTGLVQGDAARGISRAMGVSRGKIDNITVIGDGYFIGGS